MQVWTIGHSTHSAPEFMGLLDAYDIEAVADVRRFPGSRRHPQFGHDALMATLQAHGLAYAWLQQLGGRRKPTAPAGATAWRHPSFQAYAEYLQSEEFAQGLLQLLVLAGGCRTAMMCSELLWWRCHRALISDALRVCGVEVVHILTADQSTPHPYTTPARVVDGFLTYAP